MSWREQLDKALEGLQRLAQTEPVQNLLQKTKDTAETLVDKAKTGALDAAQAFVAANSDPAAIKLRYFNLDLSVVSPSDTLEITCPSAGTLVVSDGQGNGLVINAAADQAFVAETIGQVTTLSAGTYDLGSPDNINVVVIKT